MSKRQSNKLNSYQNTYEGVTNIHQSVESFFNNVNEFDEITTKTELDATGETSAKIVVKEKLATLASSLSSAMCNQLRKRAGYHKKC